MSGKLPPRIFNLFKPPKSTSYDLVRTLKRNLPSGFGKIGHFGTLDPFASGVLLIGTAGASRFNDLVHEFCPKTYLAVGKLGVQTETGDLTIPPNMMDDSLYLKSEIASFSPEFIEGELKKTFLGKYMQAPPVYSAAKYEGKSLHEWKRKEGIDIKKPPVEREVYHIEIVKYKFPYLSVRVIVSSGTYVRVLFSDMAKHIGTYGTLVALVRESIGNATINNALKKGQWPAQKSAQEYFEKSMAPNELLPFQTLTLSSGDVRQFRNGMPLKVDQPSGAESYYFMQGEMNNLLGLSRLDGGLLKPHIVFPES